MKRLRYEWGNPTPGVCLLSRRLGKGTNLVMTVLGGWPQSGVRTGFLLSVRFVFVLLLAVLSIFLISGCGGGGDSTLLLSPKYAASTSMPDVGPPDPPDLEDWQERLDLLGFADNVAATPADQISLAPGEVSGTLPLMGGWNLVSLPVSEVTSLTPGLGVVDSAFAWDPAAGEYQLVDMRTPASFSNGEGTGQGFWVYSNAASQLHYTGWENSGSKADPDVNLSAGWNLLGFPYSQPQAFSTTRVTRPGGPSQPLTDSVSALAPPPAPEISLYYLGYAYSGGTYQHEDLSAPDGTFQVGRAIWVYVHQDGTQLHYSSPELNFSGPRIAAGQAHSLHVRSDGTVWAWGYNNHGQLGDGTRVGRLTPVQVQGLRDVVAVAGGLEHSLALKRDGTVWAWGGNATGQLGDGTTTERHTPVQVTGISDVVAVAGGSYHSLALREDGGVWAWGLNASGQLGDGTTSMRRSPILAYSSSDSQAVASGAYHSMVLLSQGRAWAWGKNSSGQLGDASNENNPSPNIVVLLLNAVGLAGGGGHSLAVKADGTVMAWGANTFGQLGDGTAKDRNVPVKVESLTDVVSVAGGNAHSLALKSNGWVWAWGYNNDGQLGNGTFNNFRYTPGLVNSLSSVESVACGSMHSLAMKSDGTVWAWGNNVQGQLGDGTMDYRALPVRVFFP